MRSRRRSSARDGRGLAATEKGSGSRRATEPRARRGGVLPPPRAIIPCVTSYVLRTAGIDDAAAIAAVHISSSDEAYAPLAAEWSGGDLVARTASWATTLAKDNRELVMVAEDTTGMVIGFVGGGRARRPEPAAEVEIYVIHVYPDHRGRGVGDALWRAACGKLRGSSLVATYVDTLAELRCCSFYARRGGVVVERRTTDFHGASRTHVTYRWAHGVPSTPS
jgi:GNAT superfamily N-acetyltransferase